MVKVNDRGPFHDDRLIDLSYAAALKLGFVEQGVTTVVVEVIKEEAPVNTINQKVAKERVIFR